MPTNSACHKQNIIANNLSDLTVPWAQRIINPYSKTAKISRLDIVSTDIGTTTRVRLVVEHDGPASLPRRWFVKMPSLSMRSKLITALPRLLHTEARFYQNIAHAVPLERPTLLAAQSRLGSGATLVFSDLAESSALPGRPEDALTLDQAIAVVEKLGHFHAFFWEIHTDKNYRWLGSPVRRIEDLLGSVMAVPLMKCGLGKAGDLVPPSLHQSALRYARRRRQVMRFLNNAPQTLIHRDCHPGNFFWNQDQPGFLDWQMVRIGEGMADIAYFLATSLEPELRREHERALLNQYRHILTEHCSVDWGMDEVLERYRAHLSYPFEAMILTLAIGGLMNHHSNLELIRRTTAAAMDWHVFDAF